MTGGIIDVTADVRSATRQLTRLQREQIPFATSVAINNTANAAQSKGLIPALSRAFDRPTRYTLGGTFIARSTKRNLTATVGLIDKPKRGNRAPVKYLAAQMTGGPRRMTGFEVALSAMGALPRGWHVVPSQRVKLDRYGNLPRKLMAEVIGALKSGFRIAAGRGKRVHHRGYFVARPGATQTAHLSPGVWLRVDRGATARRGATSAVQPVLMFVPRTNYRPRLDVPGAVLPVVRREFPDEFDSAMAYALATAR